MSSWFQLSKSPFAGGERPGSRPHTDDDDDDASVASATDEISSSYPGHAAAFNGDALALARWLDSTPPSEWTQHDLQGLTVGHSAVLGAHLHIWDVLLRYQVDVGAKNARGWTVFDEAVATGNLPIAKQVGRLLTDKSTARVVQLGPTIRDAFRNMPDFRLRLSWRLTSPLFGLLLRSLAPSDTYLITKVGEMIYVDGEMRGPRPRTETDRAAGRKPSTFPKWVRSPFSLRVCISDPLLRVLVLDHAAGIAFPVLEKRDSPDAAARRTSLMEQHLETLMSTPRIPTQVRVGLHHRYFRRHASWLSGRPARATISGYRCEMYEMGGYLAARRRIKAHCPSRILDPQLTYEAFALMDLPDDRSRYCFLDANPSRGTKQMRAMQRAAEQESREATTQQEEQQETETTEREEVELELELELEQGVEAEAEAEPRGSEHPDEEGAWFVETDGHHRRRPGPPRGDETASVSASTASSSENAMDPDNLSPPKGVQPVRGKVWLSGDVPLKPRHLSAVLEVIGTLHEGVDRIVRTLSKVVDEHEGMVPVRGVVPVMMTVSAEVTLSECELVGGADVAAVAAERERGWDGARTLSIQETGMMFETVEGNPWFVDAPRDKRKEKLVKKERKAAVARTKRQVGGGGEGRGTDGAALEGGKHDLSE